MVKKKKKNRNLGISCSYGTEESKIKLLAVWCLVRATSLFIDGFLLPEFSLGERMKELSGVFFIRALIPLIRALLLMI